MLKSFNVMTGAISERLRMIQTESATIMTGIAVLEKAMQHVDRFAKTKLNAADILTTEYGELYKDLKTTKDKREYTQMLKAMFNTCHEYLEEWTNQFEDLKRFSWATLRRPIASRYNFNIELFADES